MVDAAKLKLAIGGHVRARATVLRSLQDGWFRYALANLLSISAARDATQETGLRVLTRLSAYDPAGEPVDRWSMGAVVTAVREVRQLNGSPPPLLTVARRAGLSATPPKFRAQLTAAADGLTAMLSPMTPAQRESFALRSLDRLPFEVVAGLLGTAVADVRRDLAGALRAAGKPAAPKVDAVRDWSSLARYPGDLRHELFRADRPRWLVPAAVGTLLASGVVIGVSHHYRPPPPTTAPAAIPK